MRVLALKPAKVYLHRGTATAPALGLAYRGIAIELAELPPELRTLTAGEIEDVLCIYKDEFTGLPRDCPERGLRSGVCPMSKRQDVVELDLNGKRRPELFRR